MERPTSQRPLAAPLPSQVGTSAHKVPAHQAQLTRAEGEVIVRANGNIYYPCSSCSGGQRGL